MALRTRTSFWVAAFGICAAIAIGLGAVRKADSTPEESSPGAAAPEPMTKPMPLCIDRSEPEQPDAFVVCR